MQRPGPRSRLLNRDTRNNKLSSNLSMSSYVSSWNQVTDWSAFNPLSLTPAIWLDASDTASITSVGGAVSQWNDKSGNNYHATQATPASRPTTGVDSRNGRNVLTFNGTSSSMDSTVPTNIEPFTIIGVVRATNIVNRVFFSGSTTVAPTVGLDGSGFVYLSSPGIAVIGTSNGKLDTTNYYVVTATYAVNGQFQFFINNQCCGAGTNDQYFFSVTTRIGNYQSTNFWPGQIAEIYKFHKVLSPQEMNSIHGYLQWKWALQF